MCTVDLFSVLDSLPETHAAAQSYSYQTHPASLSPANTSHQSPGGGYHHTLDGSRCLHVGLNSENVVQQIDGTARKSKKTQALAGTTFVEAVKVDHEGKKALFFVFSVSISCK